jgi:hypothetical protein
MKRLPPLSFAIVVILLMQTGCSSSILPLRDQLALHRGEFRQKLADKKELAEKFLACTRQAYDEPRGEQHDGAASLDPLFLQSPEGQATSVHPLTAVINRVIQRHHDKGASLTILAHVLDDVANDANARIDLGKLAQVIETARQWHAHVGLDEDQLEQDSSRFARMLLTYNKAYFGDLSFTAKSVSAGDSLRGIVKVTSKGFIDRSGNALLFPGISAEREMSPDTSVRTSATTVDSQRISADLVRIFLEAFFDTAFRVPAVHGATALRVGPSPQESPYPEFDADHPPIPLEALARVTRDALRAEASVTSLVGKAVRGGGVFGLQNETLAATLETAAGVIAKKLAEHEGFCYYQITQGS